MKSSTICIYFPLIFVRYQIFFLLKRYDFLNLRYIDTNGEKTSTGRMCGNAMIPRRVIDSYGPIIFEFISDSSNCHKGFNLYFDLGN